MTSLHEESSQRRRNGNDAEAVEYDPSLLFQLLAGIESERMASFMAYLSQSQPSQDKCMSTIGGENITHPAEDITERIPDLRESINETVPHVNVKENNFSDGEFRTEHARSKQAPTPANIDDVRVIQPFPEQATEVPLPAETTQDDESISGVRDGTESQERKDISLLGESMPEEIPDVNESRHGSLCPVNRKENICSDGELLTSLPRSTNSPTSGNNGDIEATESHSQQVPEVPLPAQTTQRDVSVVNMGDATESLPLFEEVPIPAGIVDLKLAMALPFLSTFQQACNTIYSYEILRERDLQLLHVPRYDTKLKAWTAASLHEVAASMLQLIQSKGFAPLPYTAVVRSKHAPGTIVEVFRRSGSFNVGMNKIRKFDVLTSSLTGTDGEQYDVAYLCITDEEKLEDDSVVVVAVIVFCIQQQFGRKEPLPLSHNGNLPHDLILVKSCDPIRNPRTALARKLSVLFNRNESELSVLREMFRKHDSARYRVTPSRSRAEVITGALQEAKLLNADQVRVVQAALATCKSWSTGNAGHRPELRRFLVVRGVPGCGKSYTCVYIIFAILLHYWPDFVNEMRSTSNRELKAQVIVLAKTNKALDVLIRYLTNFWVPETENAGNMVQYTLPVFSLRSHFRKKVRDNRADPGPHVPTSFATAPVVLSTFGSLGNLLREAHREFRLGNNRYDVSSHLRSVTKALIIDEASEVTLPDLANFVRLYPSFDGVIIIILDPWQLGPVVLGSMAEVREYLSRSLYADLQDQA